MTAMAADQTIEHKQTWAKMSKHEQVPVTRSWPFMFAQIN